MVAMSQSAPPLSSPGTRSDPDPGYRIRFVTAASLFDGHDASINIIRRLLQASGAEVIHLGHNRSVREIVDAAIEEDVQGIAVSSYQGGHPKRSVRYTITGSAVSTRQRTASVLACRA